MHVHDFGCKYRNRDLDSTLNPAVRRNWRAHVGRHNAKQGTFEDRSTSQPYRFGAGFGF